jgi:hypothetical protein
VPRNSDIDQQLANDQHLGNANGQHRYHGARHVRRSGLPVRAAVAAAGIALAGIGITTSGVSASAAKADAKPISNPLLVGETSRLDAGAAWPPQRYTPTAPPVETTPPAREQAASRSTTRREPQVYAWGSRQKAPATRAPKVAPAKPAPAPKRSAVPKPTEHPPVAGLTKEAMDNAVAIVTAGKKMNLPKRAFVIAIMTALQESNLRNLANPNVPGSMDIPNQGVGYDHDSVGLFQQRSSAGWGSVNQLMDPQDSASRFYGVLVTVQGWQDMGLGAAAQAVQRSAFPDAYDQHQSQAEQIVDAIG